MNKQKLFPYVAEGPVKVSMVDYGTMGPILRFTKRERTRGGARTHGLGFIRPTL
jgi:hypothetical protein